jgi:hypothetical protein
MQFQDFIDNFNELYFNHPVQFQDKAIGNGNFKTLQLNFYPISAHNPYKPVVKINNAIQTENSNYTVDYEQGIINWSITPVNLVTISVDAYHQKANINQLARYFNQALNKLQHAGFPHKVLDEIKYTDISGALENDTIKEINLNSLPFSEYLEIKEILQYKNDWRGIEFIQRHDMLLLDAGTLNDDYSIIDSSGSDYISSINRPRSRTYSNLKYPYYLLAIKKYPIINSTGNDALTEIIELKSWALDQALILTAMFMYMARRHYSEQINASTLRISSTMELDRILQSLNIQLINNLRFEGIGGGHTPDHRSYFNKKD